MTPADPARLPTLDVVAARLRSPILRRLFQEHGSALAPHLEPRAYARGELILRMGERASGAWLVVEGEVSLTRRATDAEVPGTEARGPGSNFGWDGGDADTDAAVRAETPVQTLFVAEERLAALAAGADRVAALLDAYAELSARRADVVRGLRMSVCFRGLSRRRVLALAERVDRKVAEAGEVVLDQGAPASGVYVVLEGELEAHRRESDGASVLVDVCTPGEVFGDVATHSGRPEALTVRATRHTALAWLPIEAYRSMIATSPSVRRRLGAEALSRALAAGLDDPEAVVLVGAEATRGGRAALTRLVAATLVREHGARPLILRTGGAPEPEPRDRDGVAELAVAPTVEAVLAATHRWRGTYEPLFLLPPPAAELERLAPAVGQLVHVTAEVFAPPGGPALAGIPTRTAALIGGGGSPTGYPARTVRLRATPAQIAALDPERARLADLSPDLARGVARLGRAITERLVGLALGGGGAFGFAHVALLRALHEGPDDVPVDMVAGASFGALVSGFYAARGLAGLDQLVARGGRAMPYTQASMFSSRAFQAWVDRELGAPRMEDLEIPMFPVATDVAQGTEWFPRTGTVGYGVRASGAMPPLFTPVLVGGSRMVDGGFVNNVPASVLRNEGANFVVASNVVARAADDGDQPPRTRLERLWRSVDPRARAEDVVRASLVLFHFSGMRESLSADAVFRSSFGGLAFWDFGSGPEVVANTVADPAFTPQVRRIKERWAAFATAPAAPT